MLTFSSFALKISVVALLVSIMAPQAFADTDYPENPRAISIANSASGQSGGNNHSEAKACHVIRIDKTNIRKEVLKTTTPFVLIAFLEPPGCGSECDTEPAPAVCDLLEKMAQQYVGKVKVGYMNIVKSPKITRQFRMQLGIENKTFIAIFRKTDQAGSTLRKEWTEENLHQFIEDGLKEHLQFVKPAKGFLKPFSLLLGIELPTMKELMAPIVGPFETPTKPSGKTAATTL